MKSTDLKTLLKKWNNTDDLIKVAILESLDDQIVYSNKRIKEIKKAGNDEKLIGLYESKTSAIEVAIEILRHTNQLRIKK